jgi:Zn finger protein HypA/HybF involved in hydrogenase expression
MGDDIIDFPILPSKSGGPYKFQGTVDFAGFKIEHGKTQRPRCQHLHIVFDPEDRRVYCPDCKHSLDAFDALMLMYERWFKMSRDFKKKQEQFRETLMKDIRRVASRKVDQAWRNHSMAICCPHCERGLIPEDFQNGCATMSKDLELKRREKEKTEGE